MTQLRDMHLYELILIDSVPWYQTGYKGSKVQIVVYVIGRVRKRKKKENK